jgi:hypothetical protein
MTSLLPVRALFAVAAIYDGLLGLALIVAAPQLYNLAGVPPPNTWAYVHFPAGIQVIFGLMFLAIARRPVKNLNLVIYGVLLKACSVATVVWHGYHGGVPTLWTYSADVDIVFAALFVLSLAPIRHVATALQAA